MFGYLNLYFGDMGRALAVANGYLENPDAYTRVHVVPMNGKVRKLRAYADNKEGKKLRELHENVARFVWESFQSSNMSYAYKKRRNIVDCVSAHTNSRGFLKTDIHAFFDSTKLATFLQMFLKNPKFFSDKPKLTTIFSACFYDGTLPLGFVSSPAISDFFLNELDRRMAMVPGIVYTRYADDFLISSKNMNAQFVLDSASKVLRTEVTKLGLELNEKKTFYRELKDEGDAIHFLGLNLVHTRYGFNRITVSGSYLKSTCMELASAIQKGDQKAYDAVRGKIAFISMCSSDSLDKFRRLVQVKLKIGYDQLMGTRDVKEAKDLLKYNRCQSKDGSF